MDKCTLLLSILLVTLSWGCMRTSAQADPTGGNATATGGNATAPGGNATAPGGNATAPGGNATSPGGNAVAPGGNGTAPGGNATSSGGNAMAPGGNGTAPGGNATAHGGNATAPGGNATSPGGNAMGPGGNATAPGGNATSPGGNAVAPGGNATVPGGNATAPAPALSPNTSVEVLPTDPSRSECGKSQLCAAKPSTCDPTADSSCFFLGAQKKGDNFGFTLSGQSDGYVAASVLIPTIGKEVVYICANNNNKVKFFGAILENSQLKLTTLSVNSVKGKVRGRTIQCTFLATVPDPLVLASKRARRATGVTLSVSTGSYNASSDNLGAPTPTIRATVSDLASSNTTVVNEISNSTNTTTPQGNSTTSTGNSTTTGGNATTSTGNSTTTGGNATTSTGNSTTSTGNSTTPAPALSPNTSVEALPTNLSRSECGQSQLCAAEPSTCDPTTDSSCFFLGAQKKGDNFAFSLSGQSDGYVAASVLIPTIGKEVVYICANNNNKVKFFGAILENSQLKLTTISVNSVKGKVRGRTIQCTFLATVPDPLVLASKRARRATGVTVSVSTGSYNASSDNLGTPTPTIRATVSDLANINTTVVNEISNSTNTTTPQGNSTTSTGNSTTTGGNATTPAGDTVGSLQTDISRTGCGTTKLCAAEPSSCDPSLGNTCSFLSAKQNSGQIYSFELSGLSDGYMASALSTSTTNNGSIAYVCANNNGAVKFITAVLNNDNTLTVKSQNVTSGSVKGKINGKKIQCTFEATLPDTTTRSAGYSIIVFNGSYTLSTNGLGNAFILVRTSVVNLSDPTANATNLITSGVAPHYHPLMQALLVTFGILVLTILGH